MGIQLTIRGAVRRVLVSIGAAEPTQIWPAEPDEPSEEHLEGATTTRTRTRKRTVAQERTREREEKDELPAGTFMSEGSHKRRERPERRRPTILAHAMPEFGEEAEPTEPKRDPDEPFVAPEPASEPSSARAHAKRTSLRVSGGIEVSRTRAEASAVSPAKKAAKAPPKGKAKAAPKATTKKAAPQRRSAGTEKAAQGKKKSPTAKAPAKKLAAKPGGARRSKSPAREHKMPEF